MAGIEDSLSKRLGALSKKLSLLDKNATDKPVISSIYIYGNQENDTDQNNYKPYDKSYIIDLISTYDLRNWELPNKLKLNPLSCSLNGLKCAGKNKLCCNTCFFTTLIKIPVDNPDLIEILAEKYFDMLSTFHYDTCPWRLKFADAEKTYNITYISMNTEFEIKRLKRDLLMNIRSIHDLPDSVMRIIEKLSFTENINFENLLKKLDIEVSTKNVQLLKLTMCNWVWVAKSREVNIFKCSCCNSFLTDDFKLEELKNGDILFDSHMPWCCSLSIKSLYILSSYLTNDCTTLFKNKESFVLLKLGK